MDLQVAGFQLRQCEVGAGVLGAMRNAVSDEARRMRPRRKQRAMPLLVLSLTQVYGAIVLLNPCAIHMST